MRVLVLIGPSGSGKSTLVHELRRRGTVELMASWTTRLPRTDEETDSSDHRFVSDERFDELEEAGFFLEVAHMFGSRYGLPAIVAPENGTTPAILVRAPLLELVDKHFPDHVTYQIESSFKVVEARLRSREIPQPEVEDRLRSYAGEVDLGRRLCHRRFDTSLSLAQVVDALEDAIAEDFPQESASTR